MSKCLYPFAEEAEECQKESTHTFTIIGPRLVLDGSSTPIQLKPCDEHAKMVQGDVELGIITIEDDSKGASFKISQEDPEEDTEKEPLFECEACGQLVYGIDGESGGIMVAVDDERADMGTDYYCTWSCAASGCLNVAEVEVENEDLDLDADTISQFMKVLPAMLIDLDNISVAVKEAYKKYE